MAVNTRSCFFFGTEERLTMFATPLQGADSSPEGWGASGTLLNGGASRLHSWGTHKTYTYEWPQSSAPETAQMMKSYRDGTFGRGLLYFIEPGIYRTNVLPASWADPSMALGYEAPPLIYGLNPSAVSTSGGEANGLPVSGAYYEVTSPAQENFRPDDSVFIPIPPGFTLHVGAFYESTGTAAIFASPINTNGTTSDAQALTPLSNDSASVVADSFTGIKGIRLWAGRTTTATSTLTATALIARLAEDGKPAPGQGPWIGGQGHSGCRFASEPTYVTNGPINGGQVGFAATFVEVGSWSYS